MYSPSKHWLAAIVPLCVAVSAVVWSRTQHERPANAGTQDTVVSHKEINKTAAQKGVIRPATFMQDGTKLPANGSR